MAPDKQEENYYTFGKTGTFLSSFCRLPKKMAKNVSSTSGGVDMWPTTKGFGANFHRQIRGSKIFAVLFFPRK